MDAVPLVDGKPKYPVVIVPGLCSSGLQVEAGYSKWLQKRIWLSVKRMGRERCRVGNTSKHKRSFFDPSNPPVTEGFLFLRQGGLFMRVWPRYYFTFDVQKKILFWYKEEDTWTLPVSESQPVNAIPAVALQPESIPVGQLSFNKETSVYLIKRSPKWASFNMSIEIISGNNRITLCSDSEESTFWRYEQFSKLVLIMYPDTKFSKMYRAYSEPKNLDTLSINASASQIQPPNEPISKNLWLDHLNLMEDGISDPPGIRVRAMKGLEAVNYLEKHPLLKGASYVFAPAIERLQGMGYDDSMLRALPYDWRIPPFLLQQRDSYFTEFKHTVEELRDTIGHPVIILAHSLGNKVVHYFLEYILYTQSNGEDWIQRHVHLFFALGAPWLGAPKSVRGICVGDKMGLDAFIQMPDAIKMSRRMGSAPWLFPSRPELHFKDKKQKFAMIAEKGHIQSVDIPEILREAGAQRVMNSYQNYYLDDPLYGKRYDKPPPVPWMLCVYGINVDTEVSFVATRKPQNGSLITCDNTVTHGSLLCREGILYETADTTQVILENESSDGNSKCSGDGTVPYASLRYPILWKKEGRRIDFEEIPGALHRDILVHPKFLDILSRCASGDFSSHEESHATSELPPYLKNLSVTQTPFSIQH